MSSQRRWRGILKQVYCWKHYIVIVLYFMIKEIRSIGTYNWCLWALLLSLLCLYDQTLVFSWTLWVCRGSSLHFCQVEEVRPAGNVTRATSRRDCCECHVYHPLPFMEPQTSVTMGNNSIFWSRKIIKHISIILNICSIFYIIYIYIRYIYMHINYIIF